MHACCIYLGLAGCCTVYGLGFGVLSGRSTLNPKTRLYHMGSCLNPRSQLSAKVPDEEVPLHESLVTNLIRV